MRKIHFIKRAVFALFFMLLVSSCVSRKDIAYFQNMGELRESLYKEQNNVKIKPDDLLTIRVSAPEPEAALPFNLTKTVGSQNNMQTNVELETYMVSNEGTVQFPVLGTIQVAGFTSIELAEKIEKEIVDYVKDPLVNVRILNFQISVLGEVNTPGTYTIQDDHISLPKALGLAGDLTIYGQRHNVLIVREKNGIKSHAYLDLTDADIINSPYYDLEQNDVVYVEPVGPKRQVASYLGTASGYLSIASVIVSIVVLITK